ncbi:hypothetical protein GCM10023142_18190 [Anaerocolumna aminovalerica]|jgi:flagellar basal body-associated protein FliL|uniref:SPFH domain / Band 7 family protein n=1 Tax=Anaerocolumna aminovalerica TaxID=1527 RepID=A0A1I5I4P8_9FIRM|nr:hypothetical protein [Anaerocolumna aminovalerica]MBU5333387.1 hypothetical protein [Anaerocolumna aminovalerica]MDU6263869.1 hypothetical protein [Anaerocolumna aminovalerica]SFO55618.1 SPFH domain / Band 7 family protein [Anaerocolumna aminovalerica]
MKKNMLSIIILAVGILNVILGAVIVFTVVPTATRTNNLISKVASAVDLELASTDNSKNQVKIEDIENFSIDDTTITLKRSENDAKNHYALVSSVSISINKKSADYNKLKPIIETGQGTIKEIISDEFSKYTVDTVMDNKEAIKSEILRRLQEELYNSDFIVGLSLGETLVE